MSNILLLLSLPLVASILIIFLTPLRWRNGIAIAFVVVLSSFALIDYLGGYRSAFIFPHHLHTMFVVVDIGLLLYFLWRGASESSRLVVLLSIVQLILYLLLIGAEPSLRSADILVDHTSSVMLLVINIVGGIIIVYALGYIESEAMGRVKKNTFIALLFFFLAVMNLIVTTNHLEIFFLAFELTTLCSYLLIRYRGDEISRGNAIQALWMNQIGGVAILVAALASVRLYDTLYLDVLLASVNLGVVAPVALLVLAAFVKGATLPFEKWLLGAMVAPTPVSAILHSATMVKIAPYLILKLSTAFTPTLSLLITLFGSFVFMTASAMALGRDYFKEILGLSTVALLGFMMAMGAIGTTLSTHIVLVLIVFHALSKALLFLEAGVLEKEFHFKYLSDFDRLYDRSPLSVWMIVIGFASLTLPPFGVFWGKFFSLALLSSMIATHPLYGVVLIFVALGSVFLTLLYFKVLTKILSKNSERVTTPPLTIPPLSYWTTLTLFVALSGGMVVGLGWDGIGVMEIVIPAVLIFVVPLLLWWFRMASVERVGEYRCGEKDETALGAYYFEFPPHLQHTAHLIAVGFILLILLGGVVWR